MSKVSNALHREAQQDVKRIIEAVERLEVQRAELADEAKDLFIEAKSKGYNVKIMKQVIKMRKKDGEDLRHEQMELEVYMHAVGMDLFSHAGVELGEAA